MSPLICQIFQSSKKPGMYLYVEKKEQFARVPEPLMQLFGKPKEALVLVLNAEKKLAKADIHEVIKQIKEQGYYLQMPPLEASEMKDIALKNSKISH